MKTVSSTEAKTRLNALLAEVEATGQPVTITSHGRPVAILSPSVPSPRMFGQLAGKIQIPDDFDAPLEADDLDLGEGRS
ncbi:type II toxin-antitoxin system Phd/YefM family antitoxin [Smaragdicoccus niigatensis]|uniref:type II toxin-antitoxin system Phd/YefM family antitoxin n=1 Tax=Smaragdicoccus niigatensis TaxID=359359 RepID=UPI000364856F|nr:type II toxin-antitoxin system prevent-host-death family antitoxin [Smaragdicoccus niigatensis]